MEIVYFSSEFNLKSSRRRAGSHTVVGMGIRSGSGLSVSLDGGLVVSTHGKAAEWN